MIFNSLLKLFRRQTTGEKFKDMVVDAIENGSIESPKNFVQTSAPKPNYEDTYGYHIYCSKIDNYIVVKFHHLEIKAYYLWEEAGRPNDRDLEFWEEAKKWFSNNLTKFHLDLV